MPTVIDKRTEEKKKEKFCVTIRIPLGLFLIMSIFAYTLLPLVTVALCLMKNELYIALLVTATQLLQLPIIYVVWGMYRMFGE